MLPTTNAEHFLAVNSGLGEGAVWNVDEQLLYWVDIKGGRVGRANPQTKAFEMFHVGVEVGVIAFRATGGLVMATRKGFASWRPGDSEPHFIVNPEPDPTKTRFNDGNVDARGRFWAGVLTEPRQRGQSLANNLYRLDPDGSVHTMESGLQLPNGIGWNPDNTIMYLTDSLAKTIYAYDFDLETGSIANRRPFIYTPDEPGVPDGLTIDSEGFLWSSRFAGWKITRYDPTGKAEREVHVPVPNVTSCAFGGANLDEIFITTDSFELGEQGRQKYPLSGDLFYVKMDIRGTVRPLYRK